MYRSSFVREKMAVVTALKHEDVEMADEDYHPVIPAQALAAYATYPSEVFRKLFRLQDDRRMELKLREIEYLLYCPENMRAETKDYAIGRALEFYEDMNPSNGAEAMLVMQMIATNSAAAECMRRGTQTERTADGRDRALKNAHKMMGLFVQQLAALDKLRSLGQRNVSVGRVEVQAGAQAIVGNVTMDGAAAKGRQKRKPSG